MPTVRDHHRLRLDLENILGRRHPTTPAAAWSGDHDVIILLDERDADRLVELAYLGAATEAATERQRPPSTNAGQAQLRLVEDTGS